MTSHTILLHFLVIASSSIVNSASEYVTYSQKNVLLDPSSTSSDGASVSIEHSDYVTTYSDHWEISTDDQINFALSLSLDNTWGYDSSKYSTIKIEMDGSTGTPSDCDPLIAFRTDTSEYIAVKIRVDDEYEWDNKIYPNCDTSTNPSQSLGTGNVKYYVDSEVYDSNDRKNNMFKNGNGDDMEPASGGVFTNDWPMTFTFLNDPINNELFIEYTNAQTKYVQRCGFGETWNTNSGFDMFIATDSNGEEFDIDYFNITYTVYDTQSPTNDSTTHTTANPTTNPTNDPSKPSISPTSMPTNEPIMKRSEDSSDDSDHGNEIDEREDSTTTESPKKKTKQESANNPTVIAILTVIVLLACILLVFCILCMYCGYQHRVKKNMLESLKSTTTMVELETDTNINATDAHTNANQNTVNNGEKVPVFTTIPSISHLVNDELEQSQSGSSSSHEQFYNVMKPETSDMLTGGEKPGIVNANSIEDGEKPGDGAVAFDDNNVDDNNTVNAITTSTPSAGMGFDV